MGDIALVIMITNENIYARCCWEYFHEDVVNFSLMIFILKIEAAIAFPCPMLPVHVYAA
jgi:hypothetical protein